MIRAFIWDTLEFGFIMGAMVGFVMWADIIRSVVVIP
jgi:hypothetical protein